MRKPATLVWIVLMVNLVAGCSSLPLSPQQSREIGSFLDSVPSAGAVTDRAREYREQGEVIKALGLLQASKQKFPRNEEIRRLITEYERSWRLQQLVLENQLLLTETRWLIESLPLLEELARGHPNNQLLKARIVLWQSYLKGKEPELVNCGIELEQENVWLARRCLSMAYRISPLPETKRRLAAATSTIEAIERAVKAKQDRREERARADRVEQLLSEAMQERRQGALANAMAKIDEALKQDPESPRVRELLSDLQEQLAGEVEVLMRLGDRLYRNQQTGAAIAVWETAMKLDPNQQQLTERILRARTVLNKLESIRATTQPSSP
ncbi:MAG: hypothetical protein KDI74_12925 [Gammaproteobacteria bacterium]|nr:hypothetical protein [Gammaproteobacteria bacterium]